MKSHSIAGKATAIISASLILQVTTLSAESTENNGWQQVTDLRENVPANGEYAVLISKKTASDASWNEVADKLTARYAGTKIIWDGEISSALDKLQKCSARYAAVIAKPEEIDRVFVAKIHKLSRAVNPDFYGDVICGIITGKNADSASLLTKKEEPLLLERGFGNTNFDQQRFRKSWFITDWGPAEYIETENFVSGKRIPIPEWSDPIDVFANRWGKIQPQYILTASHATEYNLEMPYSRGLIASYGDGFYLFPQNKMGLFRSVLRNVPALKEAAKKANLKKLPASENPKVWIAAGNCLLGDAMNDAGSMVVTSISAAGVRQFVGYTVPTWFGDGGWGTHAAFFNNHQNTSVGEAWFFNNQDILERLPEKLRTVDVPLIANGVSGIRIGDVGEIVANAGVKPDQKTIGLLHDRDVVAFYGDPLYIVKFNQEAKSTQPWECSLFKNGKLRRLVVTGTQNTTRKSKFNFWFPETADVKKSSGTLTITRKNSPEATATNQKKIFTENFIMITDDVELSPGDSLTFEYTVK